jgi:hypothetical protein
MLEKLDRLESPQQRRDALSRSDNEGGAGTGGPQVRPISRELEGAAIEIVHPERLP